MGMEELRKSTFDPTKCPSCGGPVHKRIYGEMYAGSFILNGERVEIRRKPREGYCDPIWLNETTQFFNNKVYRLHNGESYFKANGPLHRHVWANAFGPIPEGCHIHHKDETKSNCSIENLECLPEKEHLTLSWKLYRDKFGERRFSELAREKAKKWHASKEGLDWHKQHANNKNFGKNKRGIFNCVVCNAEYETNIKSNVRKWCTIKCRYELLRRDRNLAASWEKRCCKECWKEFANPKTTKSGGQNKEF